MKSRMLLLTTILTTGVILGFTLPTYGTDTITNQTVKTADDPISKAAMTDPRVAASNFVEHVNYARVSLAMKNVDLAKQHITQARNMALLVNGLAVEQRHVTKVESGRITYHYDTEYKYHYFPVRTGPVQMKEISSGSSWSENNLAVTDADIVYLTVNLSGDQTEAFLNKAEAAIAASDLKEADNQLAKLTDSVVTVDSKASMPADKAKDNIALARNFLAGKNYDGARFALSHADSALDEMQRNDIYANRKVDIIAMRKDVADLQSYITKKDPSMMEKADAKLEKWWKDLKNWSESEPKTTK